MWIGIVVFVLVGLLMWAGIALSLKPPKEPELRPNGVPEVDGLTGSGLEVVGESFYQRNLRAIVAGTKGYIKHPCSAALCLDDGNEHDALAVAVYVQGVQVGHLSRESARKHRRRLKAKGVPKADVSVPALICGGSSRKPDYGVWIDI